MENWQNLYLELAEKLSADLKFNELYIHLYRFENYTSPFKLINHSKIPIRKS